MVNLTNRQRGLLRLANQLSQNLVNDNTDNGLNHNFSVDLPGVDFDGGLNLNFGKDDETDTTDPSPSAPETLRDVFLRLQNEQVEVTTPFGPVTGTVIAVQNDYVALVEADGSQTLIPFANIELVSEL
ncbi:hypothetical protein SAMN05216238_10960 [Lentibacillus persicus]|uniref:DUF2642 domain-containing protein n=2 Tax=Lentibacillus persicus TaxID=640948 RepID=A0A1I1Y9C9_9BACI|nr:hypothetical protein SAMN05216238_10960 [Lentibacillus persicus]